MSVSTAERNALKAWLEAEDKLDFELEREKQDEAAIKLAQEDLKKARKAYAEANDAAQVPPPSLVERVKLQDYVQAAWHGHKLDGAALELNQELGIEPVTTETRIPFALLMPEAERLEFADAVTSISGTPDDIQEVNMMPIIERIWPALLASQVGIGMRMVATGKLRTRWATAGATVDYVAPNTSRDSVAYAVQAEEFSLTRVTGTMIVTQESLLTVSGLRDAMTRDLQAALLDQIDNEIFIGDGGTPTRTKGLFEFIDTFALVTANDDSAVTYTEVETLRSKYVDQLWFRRGENDRRILMHVACGNFLHTLINTNLGTRRSAYDLLAGDFRLIEGAEDQVPDKVAKTSTAGDYYDALLIGARGLQNVFVPVWNSVGLRLDESGSNMRAGTVAMQVDTYHGLAYARYSGTAGTNQVISGIQGLRFTTSNKS